MDLRRWLVLLATCLMTGRDAPASQAPAPSPSQADDEMRLHVQTLRRRLEDPVTDAVSRTRLALEIASTLDRAAASATDPEVRRERWKEAAAVLDQFNTRYPDHPQLDAFKVQATVYEWARGRSWSDALKANPRDEAARKNALRTLEECAVRLRPIVAALGQDQNVFAQNARFRLAQALADDADLRDANDPDRRVRWTEGVEALKLPTTEPSLLGFADILRARFLTHLGRFDEAAKALETASRANPAPPEVEQIDARLLLLLAKHDHDAALKLVDGSKLDPDAKALSRVHIRLDEIATPDKKAGRDAAEAALFADLKKLRASAHPESRSALIAAAHAIKEPSASQEPEAWDLLAEGAAAQEEILRAAKLDLEGANKADAARRAALASEFRLRAGAYFYRAEQFDRADPILTKVAEATGPDPSRPRAALLRALSRGRSLALGRARPTQAEYASALRYVIAQFPNDPAASEARWLLGKFRLAESDRDRAIELWSAIPHGAPRWLDARVEIAAVRLEELNNQRLNNDRTAIERRLTELRAFLSTCREQARGDDEVNEILLATARLELTPAIGRPEVAQKILDDVQHAVVRPRQRDAARRLSIVALAQLNRWVEAEQVARRETKASDAVELFPSIRTLDQSAAEAESDLRTRRIGLLLRILLAKVQESSESLPADLRAEVGLRMVRALLFSGDQNGARQALARWTPPPSPALNNLLRDLADTYARLDAYEMAIDVQRLRGKLAATGSLAWFDSRYGLAVAYYRAGKPKEALHLIEATSILHPDLGGGDLRDKFIRLRQRLAPSG